MSHRHSFCLLAFVALLGGLDACSSSDSAHGEPGSAGASGAGAGNVSGAGAAPMGDAEPASVQGITAAHNAARVAVMPATSPAIPALTWSATIAATAQAWADQCQFMHSGAKYGENIYAAAGKDSSAEDVVGSWVSEAKDYDYATNNCSATCGHYTQVVWRKSTMIGCGVTKCSKNSPFPGFAEWQFWVCNYDPPGNFNGEKPY